MPGYTAFVTRPEGDPARYRQNLNEFYFSDRKFLTRDKIKNYSYQNSSRGKYKLATKVLILGGGFSGFFTARHLKKLLKNKVSIELINKENYCYVKEKG